MNMLTRNQMKVLQKYVECGGKFKSQEERRHFNRTLVRIQDSLEETFKQLEWCAINAPDLLLDEKRELEDDSLEPHRRLKHLLKIMNAVNPRFEVALMVKTDISK